MPRTPTGKPTGRPRGTGRLQLGNYDHHTKFTLRIPEGLMQQLTLFAEGRSYSRGAPALAATVREAIAHFLACPHKRQTESIPAHASPSICQTENIPVATANAPVADVPIRDRQEEEPRVLIEDHLIEDHEDHLIEDHLIEDHASEPVPPLAPTNARTALAHRVRQMKTSMSYAAIAATLNAEGVPTVSGHGSWGKGSAERLAKAGLQEG